MTKKQKVVLELSIAKSVLESLCDSNDSTLQDLVSSYDHESLDNIEDLRHLISSISSVLCNKIDAAIDSIL